MTIGKTINALYSYPQHRAKYPWVTDALYQLGFPRADDWVRFLWEQQIFAALKTFNNLRGHTFVPQNFVVPRGDPTWPEPAAGLPLGDRAGAIRHEAEKGKLPEWQHNKLVAIGFVFDAIETRWMMEILPALQTHKQVFGHCCVKQSFVVPRLAPWPVDAWGTKLGISVSSIRSHSTYAPQVTRDKPLLDALRFVSDYYEHQWSDRILPSLQAFKRVYGNCSVSFKFIVPSTDQWPEEAWGLKLGFVVNQMRWRGTYRSQVSRDAAELRAIGFVWDVNQDRWDNMVLPAFETFYQVFNHCRVPARCVVPSEEPWPKQAWGLKLGRAYRNIKNNGNYEPERQRDQARLDAIEFGKE